MRDVWRISLPGYLLRALVVWDVRGEVGLYPAACWATPLERPLSFALAAPEGVYLSAIGIPISLPLCCARRAPAKMMRNAEISKNLRVTPLYVRSQKSQRGPATCKPLPRTAEG